jgi:hypothetical protein
VLRGISLLFSFDVIDELTVVSGPDIPLFGWRQGASELAVLAVIGMVLHCLTDSVVGRLQVLVLVAGIEHAAAEWCVLMD